MNSATFRTPSQTYRIVVTVGLVVYWLIMFTLTHIPHVPDPPGIKIGDKLAHKAAYFLLGLGLGIVWSARRGTPRIGVLILLFITAGSYGVVDELSQPLFGRDCDILDWYADLKGASVGVLFSWVYDRLTRKHLPKLYAGPSGA